MTYEFSAEELNKIASIKAKYPNEKAALMPIMWMAQKKFGFISPEAKRLIADTLNLSLAHVEGVAEFYTMYFKKPVGKHHVQVCTNVSCMICGGDKLFDFVKEKLNINNGETTPDGLFSLEETECMGACGGAPMIAVNEDFHENVDIRKVEELLNKLSKE